MRLALTTVLIVAVIVAVAGGGSMFTTGSMDWYATLDLPAFTPPGRIIGMVWGVIYALSALAAFLICGDHRDPRRLRWLSVLLLVNAALNLLWTWLFFAQHAIGLALAEMVLLNLSTLAIIVLSWRSLRVAALLLVPYFAWVSFATFLTAEILRLNREG